MADPAALILIVEDELRMRKLLRDTVETHGYRGAEAANGKDAVAQARTRNPDLVLLDLGLPDLDGIEVTKILRSFTDAPIIMVTARDQEQHKIRALDLGANDYLTKPFSVGELMARVRVALRSHARAGIEGSDKPLVFGDLRIDLAARKVFRGEEPIHLSRIEFKLLSVLARSGGRVVTKKQLLHETWGAAYQNHEHYLRVYMHALRHKLEVDPARPRYLVNEIGIGYRFKGE